MKYPFIISLALMAACASKEKTNSGAVTADSIELLAAPIEAEQPAKTPIDTIVASYPNGKKLHLMVLAYHDSLPGKTIKDFEVREVDTKNIVFRSVSKRLVLGYETDPMKGEFDSMFVVPAYSISSKDPLKVDLDFIVDGGLSFSYLGDITYPFYKESIKLKFLQYSFQNDVKWKVKSALKFTPNMCGVNETELMAKFNKIKIENHFYSDQGTDFMKQAFNCFLNKGNPNYNVMINEFRKAMAPTPDDPCTYYPYIIYLDEFILNLTYQ